MQPTLGPGQNCQLSSLRRLPPSAAGATAVNSEWPNQRPAPCNMRCALSFLRRRILRAFVGRSLIAQADAKDMLAYQHSSFSVEAGVCIEADDALRWSGGCAIAPAHPLPLTACTKRVPPWCITAPNSAASPAPLLWRAGPELSTQGCGGGAGGTGQASRGVDRASRYRRGRAWDFPDTRATVVG